MGAPSLTLISAHFGDQSWINHSLKTVHHHSELISHAFISDQKQVRSDTLDSYPALNLDVELNTQFRNVSIISVHPHRINHASLHHGQSLNFLINLEIQTSHVLILDSDCFPLDNKWEREWISDLVDFDVIVAGDPRGDFLSHPCFMILPANILSRLNFIEYTDTHWIDTDLSLWFLPCIFWCIAYLTVGLSIMELIILKIGQRHRIPDILFYTESKILFIFAAWIVSRTKIPNFFGLGMTNFFHGGLFSIFLLGFCSKPT